LALEKIADTYNVISLKYGTHATPTISNACTLKPQLASCFLNSIFGDSIEEIFESIKKNAILSKNMGGLGIYLSVVRAAGAIIKSSGGKSRGIKPLIKVLDKIFGEYIDQGGKRKGSAALYIDVWHACVMDLIMMPRNTKGPDEDRARKLFYAVILNDVFLKACENDEPWYFMSPDECPDLIDAMNEDFARTYAAYVAAGRYYK
jgi:ribonucleotide reductase alpha subunit